jgi:hypothetical protein
MSSGSQQMAAIGLPLKRKQQLSERIPAIAALLINARCHH